MTDCGAVQQNILIMNIMIASHKYLVTTFFSNKVCSDNIICIIGHT